MKARKIISVLITLAMVMSLIPALEVSAEGGMPFMDVPYIYYDFNYGGEAYRTSGVREGCFILYDGFDDWNYDIVNPFWYVVVGDVTMDDRVDVEGDVSLILADGCTLTCEEGIRVEEGSSLTIYAQSEGPNTGKLIANGDAYNAGIGSDEPSIYGTYEDCTGDVTIHGGIISATGGKRAAGIGGANGVNGGNVTIYGGCVTAYSGFDAAAIGGGAFAVGAFGEGGGKGGNVTIWGGEVFAERKPGSGGTGIGSGFRMPDSGSLTVHGGIVNAESLYCTLAIAPGMVVKPCFCLASAWEKSDFTSVFGNRYTQWKSQ